MDMSQWDRREGRENQMVGIVGRHMWKEIWWMDGNGKIGGVMKAIQERLGSMKIVLGR